MEQIDIAIIGGGVVGSATAYYLKKLGFPGSLAIIEKEPKSVGWKLRARVGTKKQWYNDVEEVERAEHLM